MKEMHLVELRAADSGKPQKGETTWVDFVHADPTRARDLGDTLARRLTVRTGIDVTVRMTAVPLVGGDEASILATVDEIASHYAEGGDEPRSIVTGSILFFNDPEPLDEDGVARSMVDCIRDEHGMALHGWIALAGAFVDDARGEWRRASVSLSLPADQAEALMENASAVKALSLAMVEEAPSGSLYDDDGRMEEISADAEDAAVNAWGPMSRPVHRPNPHPPGSEEATYWNNVFRSAYARENGK